MLKGIAPCISPDLLKVLAEMGHGDELILADAHFPGHTLNSAVVRADGLSITTLLDGILPLFELDSYDDPLVMMTTNRITLDVRGRWRDELRALLDPDPSRDRFDFYARAQEAYVVVMTGDTDKYGNILLKKGVTPPGRPTQSP